MKHIAFVMPWLLPMPPVRGGAVETLVDGLIIQNEKEKKLKITVFTIEDDLARQQYGQYQFTQFVPIRVTPKQERVAWLIRGILNKTIGYHLSPGHAYLRAVYRAMRGRHFDLIVVENHAPFVPMLAKLKAGPIDLHLHNVVILHEQQHPENVANLCRKVITVSDYIRSWICSTLHAPEQKCNVLLNCTDVLRFRQARKNREIMRTQLGVGQGEILFLYTGRICQEKGVLELANAFQMLNRSDTKLVFVGSRWFGQTEQSDYQNQVLRLLEPVKDRIAFTGYVPYEQMPNYYAAADIAVMPSIWEEPGVLTGLEAQAAGVPVIATDTGGTRQNVCPEGAILLPKGDDLPNRLAQIMEALAVDAAQRKKMSDAALEWSLGRDMQQYYQNFLDLVE